MNAQKHKMPASLFAHRAFYDRRSATLETLTMASQVKRNKYFQMAIADPVRKVTAHDQRVYRSANAPNTPSPITGTLEVSVGSDTRDRKTWKLPKALLARHATFFDALVQDPNAKGPVTIDEVEPRDFQNFVDYMHSSIYSLNQQAPGYRAIRANTTACLLGIRLGAKAYHDAAIRQLYTIFEPLARLRTSNVRKSSIRASDIEFICTHTSPSGSVVNTGDKERQSENKIESGIRQLFFDAVASHWTQSNVLNVGDTRMDTPGDAASWADMYNVYPDFRVTLANSLKMADVWRAALLRPVDEYLNPRLEEVRIKKEKDDADGGVGGKLDGTTGDVSGGGRVIAQPRTRIPALRRRNSSDRRRMERMTGVQGNDSKGVSQAGRQSEEEVVMDEEVKQEVKEEIKEEDWTTVELAADRKD